MSHSTSRRAALGLAAASALALLLPGLPAVANDTLKIGVMSGDGEEIIAEVAKVAAEQGLDLEIVPFSDYTIPNEALANGDLDANAFQHVPYLDNQIETRGYDLVPVGYTIVAPIGLYSKRYDSVADLPDGARIGVPNDPSNGGRGLLLLQAQGLITLKDDVGLLPTPLDIVENPHGLEIVELDAGIIGRSIDDLDAAVVNTDWAWKSGLSLTEDRIAVEAIDGNPYRNIIAVRRGDEDDPRIQALLAAYHTDAVRQWIEERFQGALLAAW